MEFRTIKMSLGLLIAMMAASSCQEYDNAPEIVDKSLSYDMDFAKVFGKTDANHDWTMAATLTANVQVSGVNSNSLVRIYSDKPVYATGSAITFFNGTQSQFCAPKNVDQVFAIVSNGDDILVQGYYNVVNGTININDRPVARRAAATRSTATCTATKGNVITDYFTGVTGGSVKKYKYNGEFYTLQALREYGKNSGYFNEYNFGPFNADLVKELPAKYDFTNATIKTDKVTQTADGYVFNRGWEDNVHFASIEEMQEYVVNQGLHYDWENGPMKNFWFDKKKVCDFDNATINTSVAPLVDSPISIDLTALNGVETESAQPWNLAMGYDLFGPKGFFCEQNYYWGPKTTTFDKTTLYGSTDEEKLETMRKLESGFSITTKAGSKIDVPFVYGATIIPDIFGYVYYKDGQDPLTQPHYMLMSDGKPSTNIYYNSWKGSPVTDMGLANWRDPEGQSEDIVNDIIANPLWGVSKDTNVYGTTYTLAFFGENHDQPATHEFDEGYHIVFFIGNTEEGQPQKSCGNFNYSLPELNARLGHMYGEDNKNSLTYKAGIAPEGAVKAAAWQYKGNVFMGFEDGGSDEDLNDIVFWVEGDFEHEDIVVIEEENEETTSSWIFAAEDLGGTFDYDFNDAVWEVSQTIKTNEVKENGVVKSRNVEYGDIETRILAAGGTLPVKLAYKGIPLAVNGKSEIHQLFGQAESGLYGQVNVGNTTTVDPVIMMTQPSGNKALNINDYASSFSLQVQGGEGTILVTAPDLSTSRSPQIIILPGDWEWPTESTCILDAYKNFSNWAQDATWSQWAGSKVNGLTVTRKNK